MLRCLKTSYTNTTFNSLIMNLIFFKFFVNSIADFRNKDLFQVIHFEVISFKTDTNEISNENDLVNQITNWT